MLTFLKYLSLTTMIIGFTFFAYEVAMCNIGAMILNLFTIVMSIINILRIEKLMGE